MATSLQDPKFKLVAGLPIKPSTRYIWSNPGYIVFIINKLGNKGEQYGFDVYCACCGRLTVEKDDEVIVEACEHLMEFFDKDLDNLSEEERERLIERRIVVPADKNENASSPFNSSGSFRRKNGISASRTVHKEQKQTSVKEKVERRFMVFEEEITELFGEFLKEYGRSRKRSKSVSKVNLINFEIPSSRYAKTDRYKVKIFEVNGTLHSTCECPGFFVGGNRDSSLKYGQISCRHTHLANLIVSSSVFGRGKEFVELLKETARKLGKGITIGDEVFVPLALNLSPLSVRNEVFEQIRIIMSDSLVRSHGATGNLNDFENFVSFLKPGVLKMLIQALGKYDRELQQVAKEKGLSDNIGKGELYVDYDTIRLLAEVFEGKSVSELVREFGTDRETAQDFKNLIDIVASPESTSNLRRILSAMLWRVNARRYGSNDVYSIMNDIYGYLNERLSALENQEVVEMFKNGGEKYPLADKQKVLAMKYEKGFEVATGKLCSVEGRATSVQFYHLIETYSEKTGMTMGDFLVTDNFFMLDGVRIELEHTISSSSAYYRNIHVPEIRKMLRHVITGTDGSIRSPSGSGVEFRSGWMYGAAEIVRKVKEIYRGLDVASAQANRSCGLHIHVYLNDRRPEVAFLAAAIFAKLERYFYDRMVSYSRLTGSYSTPLWRNNRSLYELLVSIFENEEIDLHTLRNLHNKMLTQAENMGRYTSLNLLPYVKAQRNGINYNNGAYGTFEIRLMNVPFTALRTSDGNTFGKFNDRAAGMAASMILLLSVLPVRLAERVVSNPNKYWPKLRKLLNEFNNDMREIVKNSYAGHDVDVPIPNISELLDMAGLGSNSMPVGLKAELFSKRKSFGNKEEGYFRDLCKSMEDVVRFRTQMFALPVDNGAVKMSSLAEAKVNEQLVDPEHFKKIYVPSEREENKKQTAKDTAFNMAINLDISDLFSDDEEEIEDIDL